MNYLPSKFFRGLRLKSSPYGLHIPGYTRVTKVGTIRSKRVI